MAEDFGFLDLDCGQRARHAQKHSAPSLPEVPQGSAFHHRKDRRPQVPVRRMRWRRSNAIARYTGLDQRRTTAAKIALAARQTTCGGRLDLGKLWWLKARRQLNYQPAGNASALAAGR
jgi:hypothetical protein